MAPDTGQSTDLFTRIAEMAVLSCWSFIIGQLLVIESHQSPHETSFHFANTNQTQLDIDLQHVQRCHGTASVQLAVRNFPLERARLDDSARSAGPSARLQMPALQLQSLFIIVFTESESAKPLGPPEQLPQLQAHCRGVVHRVGHTDTKKSRRSFSACALLSPPCPRV